MKMCDCEDFPCCDCGQEYMAQMRYEASYGYEPPYDPMEAIYDEWLEQEAYWKKWDRNNPYEDYND